ncbi:MAG TPA: leucine-rich repeat protein, partial [Draconibacterium sp.]|nr:leucine-rich repeat protein [Draconibacterium sp.]
MKAIILILYGLCVTVMLQAQVSKTVEDLSAGELKTVLSPEELNSVTNLTITGTIDARDFKTMRDDMPSLAVLDLIGVSIEAYNGPDGTSLQGTENYPADAVPEFAFVNVDGIGKKSLTSVILPESISIISYYAFYDCGITAISIPSSVTSLQYAAFAYCGNLISVNIPSVVTSIEHYVFYECIGLTSIEAKPSFPVNLINSADVFYNVDKTNCILYVPYGAKAAYQNANQWQDFINIVEAANGFSLSTGMINLETAAGSTGTATITANVAWTTFSDQSWLTVSPATGSDSQILTFTAEENTSINRRFATVIFSADGYDSQSIIITQAAVTPTAVIKKADTAPVLDGTIDDLWATANTYNIDRPFINETPTLGATTWKALWNSEGIYLLVEVTDDVFMPAYAGTDPGQNWMYDKPEIYFDVNMEKKDGLGAMSGYGHYQFAPTFEESSIGGGIISDMGNGALYSFKVNAPNYVGEYFFPFSILIDKDEIEVDRGSEIGFDITVVDNDISDPYRNRAVWSNIGEINENWANMDDAGTITLEGAEPKVFITQINIEDGTISTDNGTLQMIADIQPTNATVKNLKWSVENVTGRAKIDVTTGLLTAVMNGMVTVKATARDGSNVEGSASVTISGQIVQLADVE